MPIMLSCSSTPLLDPSTASSAAIKALEIASTSYDIRRNQKCSSALCERSWKHRNGTTPANSRSSSQLEDAAMVHMNVKHIVEDAISKIQILYLDDSSSSSSRMSDEGSDDWQDNMGLTSLFQDSGKYLRIYSICFFSSFSDLHAEKEPDLLCSFR